MLLILLAGLMVSHLIGTLIYASDRVQAVRAVGGYAATQRIANLARLLDEAPEPWRNRIAAAASDPTLLVTLSEKEPVFVAANPDDDFQPVRRYLAEQLPPALADRLHVEVSAAVAPLNTFGRHGPMGDTMRGGNMQGRGPPWMAGAGNWPRLQAAVQLSDGEWLNFATALPDAAPSTPWPFPVAMATMAIIVVLASIWAVRRATAPLRVLAGAADQLGRDVNAPPIAEVGTTEMRQAAESFNQMQARIRRLLDSRTQMLAALSHDLRTPLTLLRLRTENLPEADERERMLATIGELDAMIEASLNFARDQSVAETRRRTDISALVASIVDDMADAGLSVTMVSAEPIVLDCQPAALRRALTNLIDNAVKYGGSARVAIGAAASAVCIDIDDDGPGIPDAELQRVFEPFHRLEQSRSRETGGTGLGLPIALSIIQVHDGELTLANRPEGGLRARILLPLDGKHSLSRAGRLRTSANQA
ncbi:MAG: ATP-binding protein [Rhodopila sp.]|nr:ATP-binding protein [Rhodopila sp.]